MKTMIAYKGFDKDWKCRDFQYEVGKTYTHDGDVALCETGFHACENPIDVFLYYSPTGQLAVVEMAGVLEKTDADSKRVSKKITIKASISIPDFITAAIEYTTKQCDPVKTKNSTGDRSASSATGYSSASSATGDSSASSATGDRSASSATGDRSASSATGDRSASSVEGKNSVAMNIGLQGKAKAGKDGAIVLCNHDENYNIRHIRASKVGENGVKADTWYSLGDDGEFVEVK